MMKLSKSRTNLAQKLSSGTWAWINGYQLRNNRALHAKPQSCLPEWATCSAAERLRSLAGPAGETSYSEPPARSGSALRLGLLLRCLEIVVVGNIGNADDQDPHPATGTVD